MFKQTTLNEIITNGKLDKRLHEVYGLKTDLNSLKNRLTDTISNFSNKFGDNREIQLFSGPGRTEIGGNHTDHQHGNVIAAAVNLDAIACAAKSDTSIVRIYSEGYPDLNVDISDITPKADEKETSAALVRGVAARIKELGFELSGFDAVIHSTVLGGSGLSSSAAYEVLIGVIFNHLYCDDKLNYIQIAQIGQYAENVFFGKPCGLMDQLASSAGGIVSIDFNDPASPIVDKLDYDFDKSGHALCIIDSGADHADLTAEYAAIPNEMRAVAAYFGKEFLRDVDENEFWANIKDIRKKTSDRSVLRAMHFFEDNNRVPKQTKLLKDNDFDGFLGEVTASGNSSSDMLQNIYPNPDQQAVNITIQLAKKLLDGKGAVRVHGGGFAGTVQAYVPNGMEDEFCEKMEEALGNGCCHMLGIRPVGGAVIAVNIDD